MFLALSGWEKQGPGLSSLANESQLKSLLWLLSDYLFFDGEEPHLTKCSSRISHHLLAGERSADRASIQCVDPRGGCLYENLEDSKLIGFEP